MNIEQQLQIAMQHHHAGRLREAEQIYRELLARNPSAFDPLQLLGLLAAQTGHHAQALELMRKALMINPKALHVRMNLAQALRITGRSQEALTEIDSVLSNDPRHLEAILAKAAIFFHADQFDQAIELWRAALSIDPNHPSANTNVGVAMERLGRFEEGLPFSARAAELNPNSAVARTNYGSLLAKVGRLQEAMVEHGRSIQLDPKHQVAYVNLGFAALQLEFFDQAKTASQIAVQLNGKDVNARCNLALALDARGDYDQAQRAFDDAIDLVRAQTPVDSRTLNRLRLAQAISLPIVYDSIEHIDKQRTRCIDQLDAMRHEGVAISLDQPPSGCFFGLAYHGRDDRDANRMYAELLRPPESLPPKPPSAGKIRIAFLSCFLRDHTIGHLNRGLIANLSREQFEVIVLSTTDRSDPIADSIRSSADRYLVLPRGLDAARRAILELQLDVLFYTDLAMHPFTYSLACSRLAPIQCVTWGHPVTSGIGVMDYFISSEALEPAGSESQYTEKLMRLKSLAVYYYRPTTPASIRPRRDLGLPDDATTYGCLQTLYKFHPDFDAVLADVLRRDPRGIVVLVEPSTPFWREKLVARFQRTMPDVANRIRFVPRQSREGFLSLTAACDVMLDPLHFGGGNTTYEALAMGVPAVTLPSQFLRGRITHALYEQIGVRDCAARDAAHYVELAVAHAQDKSLRKHLIEAADGLFENPAGVRDLEQFLLSVARR